jgi:hypothetical protein
MAARTASSRRREAPRASSMLATFAQAMVRTRPTATSRTALAAFTYPSSIGWKRTPAPGSTEARVFSLVAG